MTNSKNLKKLFDPTTNVLHNFLTDYWKLNMHSTRTNTNFCSLVRLTIVNLSITVCLSRLFVILKKVYSFERYCVILQLRWNIDIFSTTIMRRGLMMRRVHRKNFIVREVSAIRPSSVINVTKTQVTLHSQRCYITSSLVVSYWRWPKRNDESFSRGIGT